MDLLKKEKTEFELKNMKQLYLIIFSLILAVGCVSEIDFLDENDSFISISGVITNEYESNIISITRVNGYNGEIEPLRAKGAYYIDGELAGQLPQFTPGELVFPIDFRIQEGETYFIEITVLDNNKVYRSLPQFMSPKLTMDSVSFEVEKRFEGTSSTGTLKNANFADFYCHISVLPDHRENPKFYRWQVDEIWEFREVAKETDPFDIMKVCYPRTQVTEYPSVILSTETLQEGPAKVRLNTREIGESFLVKHFFNAYLHTIDKTLFEFYQKAEQLNQNTGRLYDVTPAAIDGNLYNVDDEGERVLGVIEFAQVDTMRIGIYGFETKISITNFCEADDPCRENRFLGGFTPPPCKCFDCDSVYGAQTLIRPDFWDE